MLTIEPGTYVEGTGDDSLLIIATSGRIEASGLPGNPIIFAEDQCVDVNHIETGSQVPSGNLTVQDSIFNNCGTAFRFRAADSCEVDPCATNDDFPSVKLRRRGRRRHLRPRDRVHPALRRPRARQHHRLRVVPGHRPAGAPVVLSDPLTA